VALNSLLFIIVFGSLLALLHEEIPERKHPAYCMGYWGIPQGYHDYLRPGDSAWRCDQLIHQRSAMR
jgi:hypothetical protein